MLLKAMRCLTVHVCGREAAGGEHTVTWGLTWKAMTFSRWEERKKVRQYIPLFLSFSSTVLIF